MTAPTPIRKNAIKLGLEIAERARTKKSSPEPLVVQLQATELIKFSEVMVRGDIDITYHTQQRDMFESGLAALIGVHAFSVLQAIKSHANFQTGVAWPGIRRLAERCGMSTKTVQSALKTLTNHHLLRVSKRGLKNVYVARERIDVRLGGVVICTLIVDYEPALLRKRLEQLREALKTDGKKSVVWVEAELIPGPGMYFDAASRSFKGQLTSARLDSS